MSDLPKHVHIHEEGPREGFQIEPGPISTADKVKLIEALAETGLHHIQAASFVSPRIVPGWADAEDVVAGFTPKEGVHYTALWFNANGLNRALIFRNKLTVSGSIALTASEAFTQKNLHRSHAENVEAMKKQTALHLENNVEVPWIGVMAAFGCNYQGDIAPGQVISTLEDGLAIAEEAGADIKYFSLADTMGWATPLRIERVLGKVRSHWPDTPIALHLHDTRGLAVAQCPCRAQDGRHPIRLDRRRARRLPVCRSAKGCRQHLHRGAGAALRGDGDRHRCRSRSTDRGRPQGRRHRRAPTAERTDPRRQSRCIPPPRRGLIAAALARVGRPVAHCVRAVPSLCQITRFSARTESSLRDSPSSPQKISVLCSPISGARREMRQGEPL